MKATDNEEQGTKPIAQFRLKMRLPLSPVVASIGEKKL